MTIKSLSDIYFTIKAGLRIGRSISEYLSLLDDIDITHPDLTQYIVLDTKGYHRASVLRDSELEMVVITWLKDQESGVHGHPGECIFKLLRGTLTEDIYSKKRIRHDFIYTGDTGFIKNEIGYHNVKNVSKEYAVSIHIYSPAFPKKIEE
jgi:hypothetical protein